MGVLERVVVIGASGQLGSDVVRVLRERGLGDVAGVDHAMVDIEVSTSVLAMFARFRPTLVVNTAAFHNVERCELHADRAFAVNAVAVDGLALACAVAGSALLHVSTDYVFDGRATAPYSESAVVGPLNVYGISKAAGERLAANRLERLYIVRTSGLYGVRGSSTKGYTFIERIIGQAERGENIRVVDDITCSPSFTLDVARALVDVAATEKFGTYHITNAGACTWYQFATEVLRQLGREPRVEAVSSSTFPTYARRPGYSALAHDALATAGLPPVPTWERGVAAYLGERAAASRDEVRR